MDTRIHAFVDEYGDTNIDDSKSGTSGFFIVTAVLLREERVEVARRGVEQIRDRFFPSGELKSSKLGPQKDLRRLRILGALNELGLKHYSFATDKSGLSKEGGLAYKPSFFKYLNRQLYERIFSGHDNVHVTADEHGTELFMEGFKSYFLRHFKPTLFRRSSFKFCGSREEPLLQAADILSGSLARGIDPKRTKTERSKEILAAAREGSLGLVVWPPKYDGAAVERESQSDEHDELIRTYSLKAARDFSAESEISEQADDMERARVSVLEYLLFSLRYRGEDRFVPTGKLRSHLLSSERLELSEHQMRTGVIAKLRDAGVIIASGSKGYKLPVCRADIDEFVGHAESVIGPMLARLERAREGLRLASLGEVDILSSEKHELLRALVEAHGVFSRRSEDGGRDE